MLDCRRVRRLICSSERWQKHLQGGKHTMDNFWTLETPATYSTGGRSCKEKGHAQIREKMFNVEQNTKEAITLSRPQRHTSASKERAKTTMRALDRNRTCDLLVIEVYAVLRHLYPRCFHVRGAHLHSPDVIPLHRRGFAWGTAKSMEYVAQVCGMIRTLGRSVDQKRWSREEL